ncbi:GntR family transcriptional regulator/MocR family aminotransferase [Nitrobacteraceae bacterium AZCC 2161]|jgi:GntR family transcriptional regulator/MocR family aminotransferase
MGELLAGLIDVELQSGGNATLTRQLYDRLRATILTGALPPGHRLPSSRELARQLGVSRNTVSFVVDQLVMEGYLDVAQGRRPTVAAAANAGLVAGRQISRGGPRTLRTSRWAERLRKADWPFVMEGRPKPLAPAHADARAFPHDIWARCLRRAARHALTGTAAVNRASLQAALLRHLVEHRGVRAEARQIIVMPSAQASIEQIARVLLNAGDIAWLESPGYGGARAALEAAGAAVRGVALDRSGLAFKGRRDRPRLIFVTPSHQHPTGRLMPANRRQELLTFANEVGAAIIEDDYDSEFHYDGRPVAALQGLDDTGRVFYVGTFSKSTFADIRSGYAIVPPNLVDVFETAQRHSGQIVPAPMQDALAEFIDDGHFSAHIRKMTRIYRARRDRLVQALGAAAGDHLRIEPPAGGMQLLAHLDPRHDDRDISARLAEAGVTARPLSRHFTGAITGQGLFLGFAAWNEQEIDAGASVIGRVLRELATSTSRPGNARKRRPKA